MKYRLLASLGSLSIASLLVCPPTLSAGVAADPVAAAAVRKADADWAAAADAANVADWMSFYAADAIVLLPNDQLASGKERIRQAVSRLLALPHLSVAWRPIEANVARSGDLAFLIEAYELRFDDSRGVPVSDRGRRLEIWRKHADGSWKCIVDTWNLDAPIAAPWRHQRKAPESLHRPSARPPRLRKQSHRRRLQLRRPDRRRRRAGRLRSTVMSPPITRERSDSTI